MRKRKYSASPLNTHMLFCFKSNILEVCLLLMPLPFPFPTALCSLILTFSGHLHVGKRSLSWIIYS